MDKQINRRDFIKKSTTAFAGISFLPYLYQKPAASDRLRIAHIGLGGMGNNHLNWFAQIPEVDIVALCDVDKSHLNQSLKSLDKLKPKGKAVGYEDFRNILDRKDIDAITYATPDHWHSQIAILAFQAGKDVYGEKPLSYDIKEGQLMLNNLNQYDRIFQLGTQIHAGDNYHRVVELLRSGILGKIDTVRLWKTGFSPGLGYPKIQKPPKDLNWDMWLGPAPWSDYVPERCHKTYRYFLDYSGGVYADFWCHIADIVFWALQPQGLKSVVARGEKPDGIADAPKWLDVDFEFEDFNLFWTTQPPNVPGASERGIGAYFEGEKGTLLCDYDTREITINGETFTDLPEIPISIPRSPGHQQNFIDSVKSRKQPESNLDYVRSMTLPMHLGLISWQVGHKLSWNSVNESFINNEEANQYLNRPNRNSWNLIEK